MSEQDTTPPADPIEELAAVLSADEVPQDPQEGDEELFEVEVGPEKVRVPKPFKDAWDGMQGEHTKRSQSVAEERRQVEAEKASIATQQKFLREYTNEVAELRGVHTQLEAYKSYSDAQWAAFKANDPETTDAHLKEFARLEQRAKALADGLRGKAQEAQTREETATELRVAKLNAELTTRIKDWSPQKATELQTFAVKELGIPEDVVRAIAIMHPGIAQMAHDSWMLRQIQARAKKAASPTPIVPLPVKQAGGGGNRASSDLRDTDSPQEWLRKRNAQEAKLRAH